MIHSNNHPGINPHRKFMAKALEEARNAERNDEIPVGAVVVLENRIIGKGFNQVEMLKDPTAHAEMLAISAACSTIHNKYITGATLYVTLEPCPMCAGAIVWSKIKRVVFGAIDDKAGACGSLFNIASNEKLNHRVEVIQGVMENESKELLQHFFKNKRK